MNIINPDIDPLIVSLIELPELVKLGCINNYFYKITSNQIIVTQWRIIKNKYGEKTNNEIFIKVCEEGFLLYGMFILQKYNINIDAINELAFRYCCRNGHLEMARWLISLGESKNYGKINPEIINQYIKNLN